MSDQRINASLEVERIDLIHNDLSSAAFHLKARIDKALAPGGDREGVGLDIMAAVTMLAFTFEAYLNFVGDLRVEGWNERAGGRAKREAVWRTLGLTWDPEQRPASTILKLFEARDMMAHGKPVKVKQQWIAQGTDGELQALWRTFLEAGKIEIFDTFDRGMSGITFISHAE